MFSQGIATAGHCAPAPLNVNVLLVEDETRVADFIQRGLKAEGWTVTVAPDGETGLAFLENDRFDVVVLDLMLPEISGQDVCRQIRARHDPVPVLMLTALDKVDDRINGLRIGADDYLAKPFDFDELLARLEALVRRATGFPSTEDHTHVLAVGELTFDTQSLEVKCGDQPIELSAKERDILKLLMSNPSKVHSRERILNSLWNVNEDPLTNVVDVYVSRLRKKLGHCGGIISTVRGAGYRLADKG